MIVEDQAIVTFGAFVNVVLEDQAAFRLTKKGNCTIGARSRLELKKTAQLRVEGELSIGSEARLSVESGANCVITGSFTVSNGQVLVLGKTSFQPGLLCIAA